MTIQLSPSDSRIFTFTSITNTREDFFKDDLLATVAAGQRVENDVKEEDSDKVEGSDRRLGVSVPALALAPTSPILSSSRFPETPS